MSKRFTLLRGQSAILVQHVFQTMLVTYLVLLLIEQLWEGIVSVYMNLNYFLIVVIVAGVVSVLSEVPAVHETHGRRRRGWERTFVILLGIVGFIILKYKTAELGALSWVISLVAGALIVLLSFLVLEEER